MEDRNTYGQIAFETFSREIHRQMGGGEVKWENIGKDLQKLWEKVASAAILAHDENNHKPRITVYCGDDN